MWVKKVPLITRKVRYLNTRDQINLGDSDAALSRYGKTVELQGEDTRHIFLRLKTYAAEQHDEEVGIAQFLNEQKEWKCF
jgi:hypothetical protein